jgi:NAD+ synthase
MEFSAGVLSIDPKETVETLTQSIRGLVHGPLKRKGAVLGISGGIDSSVCAALCARALGSENVLGLLMPDRDSSSDSARLAQLLARELNIATITHDITPILEASGCYREQADAIRTIVPDFQDGWKFKIGLPSILQVDRLSLPRLSVQSQNGVAKTERLPASVHRHLIAATNFKQRIRKMLEYYHADRLGYAVCGTPNRLEYSLGFFVKGGDGAADFKPIAHLYKTQVYALGEELGIPAEIRKRTPTTDTFSLAQSQEEFYYALPYDKMDLCLYGHNSGLSPSVVAAGLGMTTDQIDRVYKDIESKEKSSLPLQFPPLLSAEVREVHDAIESVVRSHSRI